MREEFSGDLWSLKVGDRLTPKEEFEYHPETERDFDYVHVTAPTQDGEWIPVHYPIGGGWAEDLFPAREIALVNRLKGEEE